MKTQIQNQIPASEGQSIAGIALKQMIAGMPHLKYHIERKSFSEDGTLQMKFFDMGQKVNTVRVAYDQSNDLYNVEFWDCRIIQNDPYVINEKLNEAKGIYNDQLGEVVFQNVFGGLN